MAYLAGGARGIGTSARDPVFSAADPAWTQAMVPAVDVPLVVPPTVSTLAARGSLAVALGRRTAIRDLAAISAALAVAAFGAWLIVSGTPVLPATLAVLAMGAGPTFWSRAVAWSPDALAPALAILSAWLVRRWLHTGGALNAAIASAAAALAIAEDPAWLALLPGVAAFAWQRLDSRRARWRALLAIAAASIALVWFLASRVMVAHGLSWPALVGEAVPGPVALWFHSAMAAGGGASGVLTGSIQEFTPLGVALILIGLVAIGLINTTPTARTEGTLRVPLMLTVAGVLTWDIAAPRPPYEPVSAPFAMGGWAAVAAALAWLQRVAPARAGLPLVIVVSVAVIAQPSLTRIRLSALGYDAPSESRARMAYDFRISDLPAPDSVLVAESRRVDAAILLSSAQSGTPAAILPQNSDVVLAAMRSGRPVAAFPLARAHLERLGFLFERAWAATSPVFMAAGHVPCATVEDGRWTDVSPIVGADSFVIYGTDGDAPPAGVVFRLSGPVKVDFIEPRSVPYELAEAQTGEEGLTELAALTAQTSSDAVHAFRVPRSGHPSPVTVGFARPPMAAIATADDPTPVRLCNGPSARDLLLGPSAVAAVSIVMSATVPFGPGWHAPEADPDIYRWTAAPAAGVRVTMAPPGPVRVTITASPAARAAQRPSIALGVNGCRLPSRPMAAGQADYEWNVDAACWRSGANQMWIHTGPLISPASLTGGHDTRQLGARIGAIRLARHGR